MYHNIETNMNKAYICHERPLVSLVRTVLYTCGIKQIIVNMAAKYPRYSTSTIYFFLFQ